MAPAVTLSFTSFFLSVAIAMPGAIPWTGPMATPMGLMATAGVSPRPTKAPTPDFLPEELRRRQNNVIFPPPLNWCGFVNSLYDDPLSCSVGLTCVNSGAAMGCCTATTGICDALYTTCANYGDTCDVACQGDPAVRKCDALFPFCGTYDFSGGTYLYNCQLTSMLPAAVEFLNDYYITAIGSTVGGASTAVLANSGLVSLGATAASGSATASATGGNIYYSSSGGGLPATAIRGIAAACSIGGAVILGVIAFLCLRRRKRRRMNHASQGMSNPAYTPVTPMPPMQQQQPMQMPPKAFDGYQSVPQQEGQHYPVPPQEQPQQYPQYPSPPMEQQKQQPPSYFPAPAAAQGPISPQTETHNSTGTPSLLSASPSNARQSYYKPPLSPDVREVDGTMGNPGIASPISTHGKPSEVDGTMGNPSVPVSGHGIPVQGVPGGTPSSTEIEGNPVRASLNAPFTDVYEMPHDSS